MSRSLRQGFTAANFSTTNQLANLFCKAGILAYLATSMSMSMSMSMSNKLIAHTAGICVGTVKSHVKSIMSKLDARPPPHGRRATRGLVHLN